jgi:hypothetical protein
MGLLAARRLGAEPRGQFIGAVIGSLFDRATGGDAAEQRRRAEQFQRQLAH